MGLTYRTAPLLMIGLFLSLSARALEVVSELKTEKPTYGNCVTWPPLFEEVPVYRDPSFFLPNLILLKSDPAYGWKALMRENPQMTSLSGKVQVTVLAEEREFKNFGDIAALYESVEPRLRMRPQKSDRPTMILPIRICGPNNPYSESIGFVLVEDLERAKRPSGKGGGGLPPSVAPNPVPTW